MRENLLCGARFKFVELVSHENLIYYTKCYTKKKYLSKVEEPTGKFGHNLSDFPNSDKEVFTSGSSILRKLVDTQNKKVS